VAISPAILAAIIGASASVGTGLYEAANAPTGPTTAQTNMQKLQAALAAKNQTAATIANQIPSVEGASGGSVSPQYAAKVAETQTGGTGANTGSTQNAGIAEIFGNLFGEGEV